MGPFDVPSTIYTGVEKRKPLMRSMKATDAGDPGDYLKTAAYYLWQSRGCPLNDPEADWLEAEKQWLSRAKSA